MKYIIKNWCDNCGDFVKTRTIEIADCKGFQCVHCFNIIQTFRLPEEQIKKNRQKLELIIGGKTKFVNGTDIKKAKKWKKILIIYDWRKKQ